MIGWLAGRAPRERALLGLLALVALPLLVWAFAVQPAQQRLMAARADWDDARALRVWVALQADEAARLDRPAGGPVPPPMGLAGLEQSLISAGLRGAVSDLDRADDGTVTLRFAEVIFTDLGDWLRSVSRSWGYALDGLRIEAVPAPGRVAARLVLSPASEPR